MGVGNKRPPLPAPTDDPTDESVVQADRIDMDDSATDLATDVSRRTDATSYSIPEDGSPITVHTDKRANLVGRHARQKSHTSLMIEYFEADKNGDKGNSRPSVRVRVTPSSHKKNKSGNDAVQITGIGKDRKPSYTRRISLGGKSAEGVAPTLEGTEVSHSSESNISGRPPVEVEILNHGSDVSNNNSLIPRDLQYMTNPSDVSSMPPDSLYEATELSERPRSPLVHDTGSVESTGHLKAPLVSKERNRSTSRERITQKVMEKLKQRAENPVEYEPDTKPTKERRRRTSRSQQMDGSVTDSSVVSSSLTPSQTSYKSGATSKVSINNPRLLEMVEDTVRRLILPEIDQLKNEQKTERNRRESLGTSRDSYSDDLSRRLSKSSSSPNVSSKPKVVLNRYEDNPGEVLSRGDSERIKKTRKSSRESVTASERSEYRSSKGETPEERLRRKKSRDSHRVRDVAAAGIAGGVLTAAALRHHDSNDGESKHRRKKKSRSQSSRSQSTSVVETREETNRTENVPPMPFASGINDSEITRASILSADTERPLSEDSEDTHAPIHEVSRGSLSDAYSQSPSTPTQKNLRHLGTSHTNHSLMNPGSQSPSSPLTISARAKIAALTAAGLGRVESSNDSKNDRTTGSPAQSVSSLKEKFEDPLIPQGLRPRSRTSHTSAGTERKRSNLSSQSRASAKQAQKGIEEQLRPVSAMSYDGSRTPRGEEMEEWFQKEHEENERYRQSIAESTMTESVDGKRHTRHTDDTYDSLGGISPERELQGVGTTPKYINSPHGVESVVASLFEPSMVSNSEQSFTETAKTEEARNQDRMIQNLREIKQNSPASQEIAAAEEEDIDNPVKSRWSAIREHAQLLSARNMSKSSGAISLERSEARSTPVILGTSGIPLVDDPMPEIGHGLDDVSEVSTNPPEIQGPKGRSKKDRWSYDTEGFLKDRVESQESINQRTHATGNSALLGAGVAAGIFAAERALSGKDKSSSPLNVMHRASVEDDYARGPTPGVHEAEAVYLDHASATPNSPPVQHGDEGYASAAYGRSPPAAVQKNMHERQYSKEQVAEYEAAMNASGDVYADDAQKHMRNLSGNSHGLSSPLYDSATGKGIDHIQSKDVVALMDHLTVRDAQRNARDTEILVTLVRSAAEMRQEFDAMKKYIAEQDKMIMHNTDRDAEYTVNKVLSGPRAMPGNANSPRTPRGSYSSEEFATKRKNIFKRALKGLSSGRSGNDLTRIEDMLNQLLGDVEVLKENQGAPRAPMSFRSDSFDSRDELQSMPDAGYEPEGQAGTSSTPNQSSGHLNITPTKEKYFHSGYDGRRGSTNRVSTVMEEEDDDSLLDAHEARILDPHLVGEERMLTPTQETFNRRSGNFNTPPRTQQDYYDTRSPEQVDNSDKQRKHKSAGSSIIPKFSRWSKTTTSSDPDYKRRSIQSQASKSGESVGDVDYYNNHYTLHSDDRLRSTQSLTRQQSHETADTRSTLTRTPSPLIPSEVGSSVRDNEQLMSGGQRLSPIEFNRENVQRLSIDEDEDAASIEDAKYQAHRNSLLLEHPQPRPGPTHRHQTNLENEAKTFSREVAPSGLTDSDVSQRTNDSDFDPLQWGSNPSLSLARTNKIAAKNNKDDGPLIPGPSAHEVAREREEIEARKEQERREAERELARPLNAYDKMYYSSPLGSGHLLEPIPEVRYSLETDSGHVSCWPVSIVILLLSCQ